MLNVARLLFCAARPEAGLFWRVLSGWDPGFSYLLLIPLAINIALWLASVAFENSPWSHLAPGWLGRFALACAVAYGTWAAMIVVLRDAGPGEGSLLDNRLAVALAPALTVRDLGSGRGRRPSADRA